MTRPYHISKLELKSNSSEILLCSYLSFFALKVRLKDLYTLSFVSLNWSRSTAQINLQSTGKIPLEFDFSLSLLL